ncbi:unnamed protein product [Dibothriocephalus latus]|uniref:Uncharacterized protein n=1 Tax=Dibothriocephalus latus TaxID=60516 RepID=A0A3P6PV74_DIBLA|nr:unnamed protein product [Dibothriocephalus latus]
MLPAAILVNCVIGKVYEALGYPYLIGPRKPTERHVPAEADGQISWPELKQFWVISLTGELLLLLPAVDSFGYHWARSLPSERCRSWDRRHSKSFWRPMTGCSISLNS